MKGLREKFRKNSGFTLIEMLIVVAIIAILIMVSIPLVSGALEKARDATDQANERAAKAEAVLYYTGVATGLTGYTAGEDISETDKIYYDAEDGSLTKTAPKAYGQCTGSQNECYQSGNHAGCVIQIIIEDGVVKVDKWVKPTP